MLNNLIKWSLQNRLAVVILSALLIGAGIYSATTMPVDVFPDLTAPTVTLLVEGESLAPEEMELLVTFPIETALNGAADVRRVRSASAVGIAVVWVEFEWGTQIHRARQTVTERLATVSGNLPPHVSAPVMVPTSSIMGEIMFMSLTSDKHSPMELRTFAGVNIRQRLLAVGGVSQVIALGGDEKQYQVVLSPTRIQAYRLAVNDVVNALKSSNENVSPGFFIQHAQESVVQGIGRFSNERDIRETVVAVRDGRPIKVGDLGVVQIGAAVKRGTGSSSRRTEDWAPVTEPGVVIAIHKQPGANTLELTTRVDRALDEIATSLPPGMHINRDLFRQSRFIESAVTSTSAAVRDGSIIVVLTVVIFLASMRATLITLLAMPLSLLAAVLVLRYTGAGINTMTLGGMAIAIGMVVDDAIIDVENVVRRLRENAAALEGDRRSPLEVVFSASAEVRNSIAFATLIILLVFTPIFFLSGVEGRLLQPLGVAFTVSLAASLFVALTLTPVLCFYLLPGSTTTAKSHASGFSGRLMGWYDRPLARALDAPVPVAAVALVLTALAIVAVVRFGHDFLPPFNEGALVVSTVTAPGTSLEESDRLAAIVEKTLMSRPEVAAIGRRTGRAELDEHVQGVEASEIDLTLDMEAAERVGRSPRSRDELLAEIRSDLAMIPGIQATIGQPIGHRIDHMLSGTKASIAVKVFGEDLRRLRQLATQIQSILAEIDGVVDLAQEQQVDVATVRYECNRKAMARHELRPADVADTLRASFRGIQAGRLFEGRVGFECVVQLGGPQAWSEDKLDRMPLSSPHGYYVPLGAVADIRDEASPNFISRENVQRKSVVMCNVADRDVAGVVEELQGRLADEVSMPPGYFVEYGGQFESARQTTRTLTWLSIVVIVGVGFCLHMAFHSAADALFILLNLPLALIGGVAGVYASGGILNVASLIGFISVFGISTRNGIMLISHIRYLQAGEGVTDFREAVRRGASERLVPILMTAISSGCGLLPLVFGGQEAGKEILTPMAMVILGGLISSTCLNLLVVPSLFLFVGRRGSPTDLISAA